MTRQERALLIFLTSAALVGLGVRWWQGRGDAVVLEVTPAPGGAGPRVLAPSRLALNRASVEDLTRLPGIGPALASAIVAYREEHGPFAHVEELDAVRGIGPATLAQLRDLVSVE